MHKVHFAVPQKPLRCHNRHIHTHVDTVTGAEFVFASRITVRYVVQEEKENEDWALCKLYRKLESGEWKMELTYTLDLSQKGQGEGSNFICL